MKFKIDIDNAEHQVEAAADGSLVIDGKAFKAKVSGGGSGQADGAGRRQDLRGGAGQPGRGQRRHSQRVRARDRG